jgi:ABC-type glycerol-3-phosphate transport system permease component
MSAISGTLESGQHYPRPVHSMAGRWRRRAAGVALLVVAVVFVLPFFWVLAHSLETSAEWRSGGVTFWPSHLSFANYLQIIVQDGFLENLLASVVVASITTFITLVLGSLAGYALARLPIRARGAILAFVILAGFFPIMAMMGPLFLMFRSLHLLNSWPGVALADLIYTLPLCTWLLASLFSQLPAEVEEAAMVDGCSHVRALWHVVVPLAAPAIATAGIFSFILAWSDFAFSLAFLQSTSRYTAPLAIIWNSTSKYTTYYNVLDAMVILTSLPIIGLVLLAQRRIVSGLTAGAVR